MPRKILPLYLMITIFIAGCGKLDVSLNFKDGESAWVEVNGIVLDASQEPLPGEYVQLQNVSPNTSIPYVDSRYTDPHGRFSFKVYLNELDELIFWVVPSEYELLEVKRTGLEVMRQPVFTIVMPEKPGPIPVTPFEGDLGWLTVTGSVVDEKKVPLVGATIYCQHITGGTTRTIGNRRTNTSGAFSCDSIYLRETDSVSVQVIADGYAIQEITRSGIALIDHPGIDFVFFKTNQATSTPARP